MTMFTDISYEHFRRSAAEFFVATQDRAAIPHEQAINSNKALCLLYMGGGEDWTEQEMHEAALILELAHKRCVEVFYCEIEPTRIE